MPSAQESDIFTSASLISSALSLQFGGGIKIIRKKGKLPNKEKFSVSYGLEYGKD